MFFNGMVMKQIVQYIGYVMAVWGVAVTIWTLSAKNTDKKYDVLDIKEEVVTLKQGMITKTEIANMLDSIVVERLEPVINGQNALRSSYVNFVKDVYISKGKPLTFDDFVKHMDGIEFELKTPKIDTMDFKIKIRKKQ